LPKLVVTLIEVAKVYKTLIKDLYLKAALIRTLQDFDTLKSVLEDQCKTERANRLEKDFAKLKTDKEYQALPQDTKASIESVVNVFVAELRNDGELMKTQGANGQTERYEFKQLKDWNKKVFNLCKKYDFLKKGYGAGCFSVCRVRNQDGTITTIVASTYQSITCIRLIHIAKFVLF
jgi:hypothetical protein